MSTFSCWNRAEAARATGGAPGSDLKIRLKLTLEEIAGLALPLITIDVLNRLKPFLDRGRLPPPDCAISFQYYRGKSWVEDEIGPGGAT